MNERNEDRHPADADADLAALLKSVGSRATPPADLAAQVREAVAAEWRATVAARQPKRRFAQPWLALAASAAAVAVAIGFALPRLNAAGEPVASVARVTGAAEVRHASDQAWQALTASSQVAATDEIRTAADGRVALRRADGLELRLDAQTQLAFSGRERATLSTGSVYIDAGRAGPGSGTFVVGTRYGDVRHLGTQYLASLDRDALQVAVREGSIEVERGQLPVVAHAGESLSVRGDGSVSRSRVESHGGAWLWAESVAPEFAIEGRSLDEFLAWAGRETGRRIVYTSVEAARAAEQTLLKGSTHGLDPEAAVAAVFASEPDLHGEIAGGQIRVERVER